MQLLTHLQPAALQLCTRRREALYHPDLPIGVPFKMKMPLGRLRGAHHPQENGNQLCVCVGGAILELGCWGEQERGGWERIAKGKLEEPRAHFPTCVRMCTSQLHTQKRRTK